MRVRYLPDTYALFLIFSKHAHRGLVPGVDVNFIYTLFFHNYFSVKRDKESAQFHSPWKLQRSRVNAVYAIFNLGEALGLGWTTMKGYEELLDEKEQKNEVIGSITGMADSTRLLAHKVK